MVDKIAASGLAGIKRGEETALRGAEKVSHAFDPNKENSDAAVEGAIELKDGERQVAASTKVVKVAEKLDKDVLDILA